MTPQQPKSPTLVFNYDISCPFAYIASTRVQALAQRTNATLIYRPVLLGAIYRATAAPQGAAGSASDVYNSAKKAVTAQSMQRTLSRYQIAYSPPPQHPRKTVNALRMLYSVSDQNARRTLTDNLFKAYWVQGRDVNDNAVLLQIARESGIEGLDETCFSNVDARRELESATAEAIERGAFGVPGFWIPGASTPGEEEQGRFFWGQDRMHFVEATLLGLSSSPSSSSSSAKADPWTKVPNLRSLLPRCVPTNSLPSSSSSSTVKLEFWFDFSSPWAFLGYTQLSRLQRTFGSKLEIILKPFLLGILFREIGAPNMPALAVSAAKAAWARQDHADWTRWWNAVDVQEGGKDGKINFYWADVFPIRTPTVLRVGIVEPKLTKFLYSACWEQNKNVSDESVLRSVLDEAGYDGTDLIARANAPPIKEKLRALTAEAKQLGLCGVPTYRVLKQQQKGGEFEQVGGLVWGQDEINVVEDLIAGWEPGKSNSQVAEVGKVKYEDGQGAKGVGSKL